MMLYKEHFEELSALGAQYDINTTIVEKQSQLGSGMAFSRGHTGMANTPVEADIEFPFPLLKEGYGKDELKLLLSYRTRYEQRFGGRNQGEYFSELREINLPGAMMFKRSLSAMSSTPEGILEQDKAFLMRRSVGEEELETFKRILRKASKELPFYKLQVEKSTMVKEVGLKDYHKATATAEHVVSGKVKNYSMDIVRLDSGTTLTNPICDPEVREFTFCDAMNADDLKQFLSQKGMLGGDEKLIPGKRIISGGLSLSGLDQIAALSTVMDLFEEDEDSLLGYKVTDFAKERYHGALAFINRTSGRAAIPRHAFTHHWQQGTPVIGRTENLHALFLHGNGEGVFQKWYDILECAVGRAVGCTPDEVGWPDSTESLLESQLNETQWHLECRRKAGICERNGDLVGKKRFLRLSTRTLYGAWRQASLSLVLGHGLEDEEDAIKVMDKLAPITWKARRGYMYHRAQLAAVTNPKTASKQSNMGSIERLNDVMRNIVASPVEVHSMFQLLVEAGIAKYYQAPYGDVSKDAERNQLELYGEYYDALMVSGVMTKDTDIALNSLVPHVTTVEESNKNFPKVGMFRRLSNLEGVPMPVESNTLLSKGFTKTAEDGKDSLLGSFGFDVNNRDSALSDAPSFTMRRMALAHLMACGVDAHSVLDKIHQELMPSVEAYNSEVKQFKEHYENANEIWAYLKAIKKVSGKNGAYFAYLYDKGMTLNSRKQMIGKMAASGDGDMEKASNGYYFDVLTMPAFKAPSREEFLGRFMDATEEDNARAYERAREVAREILLKNSTSECSSLSSSDEY